MAMEERTFTRAEMKLFTAKYEIFQTAQRTVEEFVEFLKEQHDVVGDGWQLGQNGFFRMVGDGTTADASTVDVPPGNAIIDPGNNGNDRKVGK